MHTQIHEYKDDSNPGRYIQPAEKCKTEGESFSDVIDRLLVKE
ncbi:antitoxin VapB family protein [Methanosarcina siciliae]|nr:antitoxin VapB family protein [Methanosarcina siciliae]